jgi:2-polyprenyl-3-methyl-5-hydroxy-6-metoxy-1,4-benzoquinol methylase
LAGRAAPPLLTASGWLRFDAIRRALRAVAPASILEVGAGQGAIGAWLASRFDYVGVELDEQSRAVASERVRATGAGEVVPNLAVVGRRRFDLVCAFEVLEHIEDDRAALREWRSFVEPGGAVLLSVPAHPSHFGPVDEAVGHFRRYDAAGLHAVLESAELRPVWVESYGAFLGHAIERAQNVLAARTAPTDKSSATATSGRYGQPSGRGTALVRAAAAAPFRAVQAPFRNSEIGIGYVVLARLAR